MIDLRPLAIFATIGLIAVGLAIVAAPFLIWYLWQHLSIGWRP